MSASSPGARVPCDVRHPEPLGCAARREPQHFPRRNAGLHVQHELAHEARAAAGTIGADGELHAGGVEALRELEHLRQHGVRAPVVVLGPAEVRGGHVLVPVVEERRIRPRELERVRELLVHLVVEVHDLVGDQRQVHVNLFRDEHAQHVLEGRAVVIDELEPAVHELRVGDGAAR